MFDMFNEMFDFDHNGELNSLEKSAKFSFVMGLVEEEEKKRKSQQEKKNSEWDD